MDPSLCEYSSSKSQSVKLIRAAGINDLDQLHHYLVVLAFYSYDMTLDFLISRFLQSVAPKVLRKGQCAQMLDYIRIPTLITETGNKKTVILFYSFQNVTKTRSISHCCDGWEQIPLSENRSDRMAINKSYGNVSHDLINSDVLSSKEVSFRCQPICPNCKNGKCMSPGLCKCDVGYEGQQCDQSR